ncbi:hypothetical protein GJ496_010513 [Pomphorhynchus laevis]|nr:hypothetical protein GJ496_010513 [Pomphorhynchus laevis]
MNNAKTALLSTTGQNIQKKLTTNIQIYNNAEEYRLKECSVCDVLDINLIQTGVSLSGQKAKNWRAWGPYLSDRAWGTVREDYSIMGNAWESFPFEHAVSRAYRWSDDGIGGICDSKQIICISPAFWNERDPILKERLFGLANHEGNHGEDVKECYYYVDNTPTHSYMKMVYRYPQVEFPYQALKENNTQQDKPEYEIVDALRENFANGNYFNISIEYCKLNPDDIFCKIKARNCSNMEAKLHIIQQAWFRNNWSWPCEHDIVSDDTVIVSDNQSSSRKSVFKQRIHLKPIISKLNDFSVECSTNDKLNLMSQYEKMYIYFQDDQGNNPESLLFTENETNWTKIFGENGADNNGNSKNPNNVNTLEHGLYFKDGINNRVVLGNQGTVNLNGSGTKVGAHFSKSVEPFGTYTVWMRLSNENFLTDDNNSKQQIFKNAKWVMKKRASEANEFYDMLHNPDLDEEECNIQRQAFAGLLWNKQFYQYSVSLWYADMDNPLLNPNNHSRQMRRNHNWMHLRNDDIISMPDKWEYPWYAAWDIAFHAISLAMIDMQLAKQQVLIFLSEEYMHPNGQIPAYEWNFDDVNPPLHAWAIWRIYCIDKNMKNNKGDLEFLQRAYHKLLLNFAWWINKKDMDGNNVFEGGFLGMDNIGVFDRSHSLPTGGHLEQADGSAWMAMYCLNMLAITLELAVYRSRTYEGMVIKFFDHFVLIANTMGTMYSDGNGLWDEEDGFFYDVIKFPHDRKRIPIKVRSFVGLIPLFAVETIENEWLSILPKFKARIDWYRKYRPNILHSIAPLNEEGNQKRRLLSVVNRDKFIRIMTKVLDENNFLSNFGLRTLSKYHEKNPYSFNVEGKTYSVEYEPGESKSAMFGGNSNWRGPIWFPVNFLMIESLQKFHRYYGDTLRLEMPTGSEELMTLEQITVALSQRLCRLFLKSPDSKRPMFGEDSLFETPEWSQYLLFYEYFDSETGKGLGASHQTGWTSLVAKLTQQCGINTNKYRARSVFFRSPNVEIMQKQA